MGSARFSTRKKFIKSPGARLFGVIRPVIPGNGEVDFMLFKQGGKSYKKLISGL